MEKFEIKTYAIKAFIITFCASIVIHFFSPVYNFTLESTSQKSNVKEFAPMPYEFIKENVRFNKNTGEIEYFVQDSKISSLGYTGYWMTRERIMM